MTQPEPLTDAVHPFVPGGPLSTTCGYRREDGSQCLQAPLSITHRRAALPSDSEPLGAARDLFQTALHVHCQPTAPCSLPPHYEDDVLAWFDKQRAALSDSASVDGIDPERLALALHRWSQHDTDMETSCPCRERAAEILRWYNDPWVANLAKPEGRGE